MFLIKPSYQILAASNKHDLPYSYDNSNTLIEVAGRTCYKSEDKITEDSSEKFVEMLKNRGHNAMIEHSWELRYYESNTIPRYKFLNYMPSYIGGVLVAGNQRAFDEWDFEDKDNHDKYSDLIPSIFIETIKDKQRWDMYSATVKFVCDTGVTHETVRHRPPAFAQESTRFCNYSKNKFGNQLTYIIPPWTNLDSNQNCENYYSLPDETDDDITIWLKTLNIIEVSYLLLIKKGWKPEEARSILPKAIKTEIVVSCDLQEWKHIFKLRTSSAAHPQMRELMIPLYEDFKELYPDIFKGENE